MAKNYLFPIFILLVIAVLGCTGIATAQKPAAGAMPEVKKNCSLCHASPDAARGALKKPLPVLCAGCHSDRKQAGEHRVDMVPSMAVKGLPLSEGRMTCITCHDPHSGGYGKMLRIPAKDLCFQCHKY